jgi:hypothetical protein
MKTANSSPEASSSPSEEMRAQSQQTQAEVTDDNNDNSTESVDDLLTKLYESNPDIDTPRAMQALKSSGITITGQAVGRKLAAMRAKSSATISES